MNYSRDLITLETGHVSGMCFSLPKCELVRATDKKDLSIFMTGPAKIGHVGTSYTQSLYRSYLSSETK